MNNLKEKIILGVLSFVCLLLFGGIWWVEREWRLREAEVFVVTPFEYASIKVDLGQESLGPMPGVWRALAQGGEEAGRSRMLEQTVEFVKPLGVDYIRLDHIFDDDYFLSEEGDHGVVRGRNADGSLDLDWSGLDKTVDDILASGAKPFFSLSYLPEEVGPGKIGRPNNWGDWQDLVKQTKKN